MISFSERLLVSTARARVPPRVATANGTTGATVVQVAAGASTKTAVHTPPRPAGHVELASTSTAPVQVRAGHVAPAGTTHTLVRMRQAIVASARRGNTKGTAARARAGLVRVANTKTTMGSLRARDVRQGGHQAAARRLATSYRVGAASTSTAAVGA